jgi:hypothetical protein
VYSCATTEMSNITHHASIFRGLRVCADEIERRQQSAIQ